MSFTRIVKYLFVFLLVFNKVIAKVEVRINQINANSCLVKATGFSNINQVKGEMQIKFKSNSQPIIFNNCNFLVIDKQKKTIKILGGFANLQDCNSQKCSAFISKNLTSKYLTSKNSVPTNQPVSSTKMVPKKKSGRLLIGVDAGHGGKDPGAIGRYGTKEKEITLAYAKHLKKVLENGGYDVYLTRTNDEYVELHKRIDMAINKNVDIFISIHADAAHNKEARGATIYALSPQSLNEATQKVENRTKISGNFLDKSNDKDLMFNILNIQHNANVKQSFNFANILKVKMEKAGINFTASPIRSANFAVLKSPTFPAILIELGYISNAKDERLLKSSNQMNKTSISIKKSLDEYTLNKSI